VISQATLTALPTSKSVGSGWRSWRRSRHNGVDSGRRASSPCASPFSAPGQTTCADDQWHAVPNLNGDGGGRLYFVNPVTIQENVIDLGAGSASIICRRRRQHDSARGRQPVVRHRVRAYTNHSLQSDNLSDDLKARPDVVNGALHRRPECPVGGPIVRTSGGS
jgi:hypothetical protein